MAGLFLAGDIFDFWFEYRYTIPKGFIRFQAKLLELREKKIPVFFFTGNHDMWMFDYFPKYFDIPVIKEPVSFRVNDQLLHVGHGDGLGPGDRFFKFLKKVFGNKAFQWCFQWLHPNIGMWIANYWSSQSRLATAGKEDESHGENEWIFQYCREMEQSKHHDLYIFGHRHLPLEMQISDSSKYYNLGEWVFQTTFLEYDGTKASLKSYMG
jgi:UDP-2,3-diacylglucosamine hydrolase